MLRVFLIIIFGVSTLFASASTKVDIPFSYEGNLHLEHFQLRDSTSAVKPKAKKLKAVLLAVFLGHFGVHRIYLGTTPNVPVVYSLTLGGGFGILPLLDIVAILSTDDLSQFSNNKQVFMWSGNK